MQAKAVFDPIRDRADYLAAEGFSRHHPRHCGMEDPMQPFPETRWSLIARARCADTGDTESFGEWCRSYWRPVRDYILAHGTGREDAEDLAQRFFERMVGQGPEKALPGALNGAFRAYLKRSVKNFLIDHWRAQGRQRRGGGAPHVPVDGISLQDPADDPETAFARAWTLTMMERAMERLRVEMEGAGRGEFFQTAAGLMDGREPEGGSRGEIAESLGMTDGAFRVALHRTRQRFRTLIEEELRETVTSSEELEEEIRYLLSVWA